MFGSLVSGLVEISVEGSSAFVVMSWVGGRSRLCPVNLIITGSLPSSVVGGCGEYGAWKVFWTDSGACGIALGGSEGANRDAAEPSHLVGAVGVSGIRTTCSGIRSTPSVSALLDLKICMICLSGVVPFS